MIACFPCSRNSFSSESVVSTTKDKDRKSRPVSTGDLDKFYYRDNKSEYAAIEEEESKEVRDKSSG